jgi:glycosyltransferase involved in cell wall biosynthesis
MVITNNLRQASYRLRIDALREPLSRRDIFLDVQVRPRSFFARRKLLRQASGFDAVILQRKLLDPMDVRLLRRHAPRLYYDVDDAVMYHSRPVGRIEQWRTMRRFRAVARAADCVVAGNEYLAHLFQREGAGTRVLPTVVDPRHYQIKSHQPAGNPALVWIGSQSTLPYLKSFGGVFAEAAKAVPGLRLIVVADEGWPDAPIPSEHVTWSEAQESAALVQGDIGIAPTPEDRWTLGKCGFKIIQYMATGLPVIASPVGANQEIVLQGDTGFLPTTPGEWADAIALLAGNVAKRGSMGQAARRRVEEHFSLARAVDFWAELLQSPASGNVR